MPSFRLPLQLKPKLWVQRYGSQPRVFGRVFCPASPSWSPGPYQPLSVNVLREGEPSPVRSIVRIYRGDTVIADRLLAVYQVRQAPVNQQFLASELRGQFVVQVVDEGEPRLGILRWPVFDANTSLLLYNLTEGQGGRDPTVPARIATRSRVSGQDAVRQVVVIERQLDGDWRVAGAGQTALDGTADIALEVTAGGTRYALGLDDWGLPFEANAAVAVGQRIRPSLFAGWLYEVTEPGQLPASEPIWWPAEGDNASRPLGTARAIARRYFQPIAHGPVNVELN